MRIRKLLEKDVEKAILQYLEARGDIYAFKIKTVGTYDPVRGVFRKNKNPFYRQGTSDILGFVTQGTHKGRWIAIEVKSSPKSRRTPEQIEFIRKINESGHVGLFAWSPEIVQQELALRLRYPIDEII